MTMKHAWPLLALVLASCGATPKPQPIRAVAEQRQCPLYPLPPAGLLQPPRKLHFLPRTPSPQPNKRSSSTS